MTAPGWSLRPAHTSMNSRTRRTPLKIGLLSSILLAGVIGLHGDPPAKFDRFGDRDRSVADAVNSNTTDALALRSDFPGSAAGELPVLPALGEHPEIQLREAFAAEISGDNRRALEAYQAFFADGEDSAHARASYGRLLAVNRRNDDALRELDRAIELAPQNSDYVILKAEVLRRGKHDDQALEFLNEVLYRYEDDPGIEFLLGELYYDGGDFPSALKHHKRTLVHLDRAGSRASTYRSISLWRLADLNLRSNRLERSRGYLVQYLRHNPRRHYPRFILADRIYYRLGRYEDARRELETLLRSDKVELAEQSVDLTRAYGLLARIYYLFQDVRFVETLRQNAAYNKNNQPGIVERSLALAHRGKEREALQYLLPIVQRQEDTVFIPWVAILRIVSNSGRPELYAEQLTHVASIAEGFGRHQMAFAWLRKARDIKAANPRAAVSDTRVNQVFAAHYEAMGQNYRASLYLDRAIRAAEKQRARSETSDAKQPAKAEAADEFEEDPTDVIIRLSLTRAAILGKSEVGRFDQALDLVRSVGETALAYATRGEIEFSRGNLSAAEAAYDRSIELVPIEASRQQEDARVREVLGIGRRSRARYHFMRAVVRYDREAVAGAIEDLEQSLELNPKFAMAANFLAYLYARENKKLLSAFRLVDEAIESDPANGHYIDTLAWIHYRRGEFPQARYHAAFAVRLLEVGAETSSTSNGGVVEPEMLAHLGDILAAMERPEEAHGKYRRARALLEKRQATPDSRRFGVHEQKLLRNLKQKLLEAESDASGPANSDRS